jgi:integrase/recombinase XerD
MTNLNIKQKVHIRLKPLAKNRNRIFLDWFSGKKRNKEYLNLYLIDNPKGIFEKQFNKDVNEKAELLRSERERQLFSDDIDLIIEQKEAKNKSFIEYFESYVDEYPKKDKRVMKAVLNHFKEFAPKYITFKEITEDFCEKFKRHLLNNLTGESPQSYFTRYKKMLRQATKEKRFKVCPAQDVKNEREESGIKKDVLEVEELQLLAQTRCGNETVKKAFILACYTGLRYVDITGLKWANITDNTIELTQAKTSEKVIVSLNDTAKGILQTIEKTSPLVFDLPSHTATNKNLKNWAIRAKIDKHITFHVARHTFGTLLAYYDASIVTISSLLGHTSFKHTGKYIRASNELKIKAVNTLPELNLS